LELNAAQILNNNIIEDGFELCILSTEKGNMYGKTLGIQNIDEFVHRDIDKPAVNIDMGVLPHKLARIMVNLAQVKEGIIWDPFCGSGTILIEAATLGLDVVGTDIDLGAVEDTKKNISWLVKEGIVEKTRSNIFYLDINNVDRKTLKELKRTSIKAVICEPFMGPPQRRLLTDHMAKNLLDDVKKLYVSLFRVLNEVGKEGFKVVLIIPSYKTNKGWQTFNISELIGKKWSVLNSKFTPGDLKWMRNNSIITRNIFVLSKR
jgi:tRNA G10  N-methylase Trm11